MELPILARILGTLIAIYLLYKTFLLIKKRRESLFEFLLWLILGFVLIIFALFPDTIDFFSRFLGTTTAANAVFAVAILIILFLTFFIFKTVKNLSYNVSKLNEELSVLKSKDGNKEEKDTL